MIDYVECFYNGRGDNENYEIEAATQKAFSSVLPLIINNELTQKQSICLRYRYINKKSQAEIAQMLHLSQPTVSRHIAGAKEIVNNKLKYCHIAVASGLNEFEKLMMQ